jgi:hypothetical protein
MPDVRDAAETAELLALDASGTHARTSKARLLLTIVNHTALAWPVAKPVARTAPAQLLVELNGRVKARACRNAAGERGH